MLFVIIITTIVSSALTGLAAKFILDRINSEYEITWKEYVVVMLIISLIAAPIATKIGWDLAKSNTLTYEEYLNGWEDQAITRITKCERDGGCRYEYDCDPYIEMVSYPCNCNDKGCDTCFRPETRYHDCPYVDEETDYIVKTTLGDYVISTHRFPDDPQSHRWRKSESIPQSVINRAGVGEPQFWTEAKNRLREGNPGPVTKRMDYENYIYASDSTILKQYSDRIRDFLEKRLLPPVQTSVHKFYYADKVSFVGFHPKDSNQWQSRLSYFNAALGTLLQGDLHLVIVQNEIVNQNPDVYSIALKAYWQDVNRFGKEAFSKNGIAVILGTKDGKTVSWGRAFTGMPMGNEKISVVAMHKFKGIQLDPEVIIGSVHRGFFRKLQKEAKIQIQQGKGVLEDLIFGISDEDTRFRRISMTANDEDDNGTGFLYLASELKPEPWQQWSILISVFLFCCIGWLAAIIIGVRNYKR